MNSSNFRFTLDLHSIQSQYSIPVMVGDTSVTLHISITDGGVPYVINNGCLAKLSIKRPTGTHLEEFCSIRNNAIIEYPFRQNENTCAVEGIHHCDITLYGPDGEKVGGPRFTMVVSEKVIRTDDIVVTDEDLTVIDAIIKEEAQRQLAESERVAAEEERLRIGQIAFESAERAKISEENAKLSETNAKNCENSVTESADIVREFADNAYDMDGRISRNDKRITNLEQGIPTELFETDGTVAHIKYAPPRALPYAEIGKLGGMVTGLKSGGANMIDHTKAVQSTTTNGVTFTNNGDGSFTVNGEASAQATYYIHQIAKGDTLPLKEGTTYTISGNALKQVGVCVYDDKWKTNAAINYPSVTFTITDETKKYGFYLYVNAGVEVENVTVYPMLNVGTEAAPFKPYKEVVDTFPIPIEVQALEGYGEWNNYIDFERRIFVANGNEVDISALISSDNFIKVEGGGTITFVNEHEIAVPSEITYMLKEETV